MNPVNIYVKVGMLDLIFVLMVALKLCEKINWHWGYVIFPLYLMFVFGIIDAIKDRWSRR